MPTASKPRHMVLRGQVWHWEPSPSLRKAGFTSHRLGSDTGHATREAERLNAEADAWRAGIAPGAPRQASDKSVDGLIASFLRSGRVTKLQPRTRQSYEQICRFISDWCGDSPVMALDAAIIEEWYLSTHSLTPSKANHMLTLMRMLFRHAEVRRLVPGGHNPAAAVRGIGAKPRQARLWSREEWEAMIRAADRLGRFSVGTAIFVNWWLGQRRGDILGLPASFESGIATIVQNKTQALVRQPIFSVPELRQRIEAQQARNRALLGSNAAAMYLILSEETKAPYTADNFRKWFDKVKAAAAAELPSCGELTYQTLRHTVVTMLAEAGCTHSEIASVTGHTEANISQILKVYRTNSLRQAENAYARRRTNG